MNHVDLGTQELTQTYSNMKKELTYSYHNGYIIPSRFGYLGTEEDIKVKKSNLDKQFIHMHEEWERIDHSSQEDKPKKKTLKNLFK